MMTYERAEAAFEAGGRFYREGVVFIVTRVPRSGEEDEVYWVTDAEGLGDVGTLLYSDGRVEKRTPLTPNFGA